MANSSLRVARVHHVQITVPKDREAEARAFYAGVLGLREIDKPASLQGRGGLWLDGGEVQLHIGTEDGFDRRTTKAHVAYEVADLAQWRAKLELLGLPILESVPIPGYDRFEFRDPFGNRVELIQPLEPR
jgi:catechol 2,3-dioxygenase-like lactoylglutathione lyase family enzyme